MTEQPEPTHGQEMGPCAICGKVALPCYGEFLCTEHGSKKYADKAKERREEQE
jgi:hypothetical protein